MGKEKRIDSTLLDKAIVFATNAHKNTERRGKGFPYIVHPLEVVSIVSTMTSDQELLAAAVLHDTVEDTDVTIEDIRKEFGNIVADLVDSESDKIDNSISLEDSWKARKEAAIKRLAAAPIESKIVALGDKLSNMRALNCDYKVLGDELWNRFHNNDPKEHEWHYRGLADSLKDLKDTEAYKEFVRLIDETFSRAGKTTFNLQINGNRVALTGDFNLENSLKVESAIKEKGLYIFDFENVYHIDFGGLRTLLRMYNNGIHLNIEKASKDVAHLFYVTGVNIKIRVTENFNDFDMKHASMSGEGFTSTSYFIDDNDSMLKLYNTIEWDNNLISEEKRCATSVMLMGIPTPFSGELVKADGYYGLFFERILKKKSLTRLYVDDLSRRDELAKRFADLCYNLHHTKCDKDVFSCSNDYYKNAIVAKSKILTDVEKIKICNFIDSIPVQDTCVHGDLHIGNVIVTDNDEALFIDLGDFRYGDPRFDMSMFFVTTHSQDNVMSDKIFHTTCENMNLFWEPFIKYYLRTDDENIIKKYEYDLLPFVALRMLFLGSQLPVFPEGFYGFIKKNLLERICNEK